MAGIDHDDLVGVAELEALGREERIELGPGIVAKGTVTGNGGRARIAAAKSMGGATLGAATACGKAGALGDKVKVSASGSTVSITTSVEVPKRYMKYLTGCSKMFRVGYIDVDQFTLVKP